MNEFRLKLANKGFTIDDFCEYWHISYKTYNRYTNNHHYHDKLNKMIKGME